MPCEWSQSEPDACRLRLWPYRSLGPRGFAAFIGATALMLAVLPRFSAPRSFWGLLPFIVAVVAGMWWALRRSWQDAAVSEVLTLDHDRVAIRRTDPDGTVRDWEANPYWTAVNLRPLGGPVAQYLTLKGAGREVELGAFLTPEERVRLAEDLRLRIAGVR